jgi:PPOX class probable F420-dependent enzyme
MLTDEVRTFLKNPLIARMATVGPDGYPHVVPVWFDVDGDDLVIIAVRSTKKVGHVLANPKGALTVGGAPGDGGGYLFKGDFSLEDDPDDRWVRQLCHRYDEPAQAEKNVHDWADLDIILMRLKPKAVIKV